MALRRLLVGAAALVGVEVVLVHLGRTRGSTRAERRAALAGDELIAEPDVVTTHAVTIDAPAECVWPWLVQMGWGRGGWYTARWVDRLRSLSTVPVRTRCDSEWQGLAVGDHVPDGPPETECGFTVVQLEPRRALVFRSRSHLPKRWRDEGTARIDWTWAFVLESIDGGVRTRFVFRSRWTSRPWWLTLGGWLLVAPADGLMSRAMLRGVRARAEALRRLDAAGVPG